MLQAVRNDEVYVVVYDEADEPADALVGFTSREEADKYIDGSDVLVAIRIHVYDKAEDAA
jgi:hypothetical protein